jgi:hypothetical protein
MWCGQFFITALLKLIFGSGDDDSGGDCGNGAYVS